MHLLPAPKSLSRRKGDFALPHPVRIAILPTCGAEADVPAAQLAEEIAARTGCRPEVVRAARAENGDIALTIGGKGPAQGYRLAIGTKGVNLEGNDAAGLYYGVQTLRQIVRQAAPTLPHLRIEDAPFFAARGFYHDCTRGKVPTRETLFRLVETLAHYKVNQLQLYVEHTFAFRNHPDLWAGADPLTPEDILALDAHCRRHHIELVPSLSTFGHSYTLLRSPRKEHLNELPVEAGRKPYSWHDRGAHYTLDPSNPETLALIDEMIGEYAELHTSPHFNICCDETWDLGHGRSEARAAKEGVGRVYLEYLKQLMEIVRDCGRRPMFWGDIVLKHPELIDELPKDALALNWDYGPKPKRLDCPAFGEAGLEHYVCPGVSGWNTWMNRVPTACDNILAAVRYGRKHGASGLLNTDWGDYGHVNALGCSYHGLVLGAAASWNAKEKGGEAFDRAFSLLELGDPTERAGGVLRSAGGLGEGSWPHLSLWLDPAEAIDERRTAKTGIEKKFVEQLDPRKMFLQYGDLLAHWQELRVLGGAARPRDPLVFPELLAGVWGNALVKAVLILLLQAEGKKLPRTGIKAADVADDLRRFEAEASALWHRRNRPSEYHRIRAALTEAAVRLDRLG